MNKVQILLILLVLVGCLAKVSESSSLNTPQLDQSHTLNNNSKHPFYLASSDDNFDLLEDEFEMSNMDDSVKIKDPFLYWNQMMFHFNDKFYLWILNPVSKGYKTAVPEKARSGISNFVSNLTTPIRIINCLAQFKIQGAASEFARFLANSTVGVLGFGDPAKKYLKLEKFNEDLGQTLGKYGIGNGIYIVWPFIGSSTLRDSIGILGDAFLNPINYLEPLEKPIGVNCVKTVNRTSFHIGDYEALKEAAIEPYSAFKDAYLQHRMQLILR